MRNDGQILGMDGDVVSEARDAGEPRFRLYRLLPGPAQTGFAPQWQNKIVRPSDIDWGDKGSRPRSVQRSYDKYLNEIVERDSFLVTHRQDFYAALAVQDEASARSCWNAVARAVGGLRWEKIPSHPLDAPLKALGILATLRTGKLCIRTKVPITNLPQLVNSVLLEPMGRRCWTHAFDLMCQGPNLKELRARPSVSQKCERNLAESRLSTPIDRLAGPVFDVFFPEGAFLRAAL